MSTCKGDDDDIFYYEKGQKGCLVTLEIYFLLGKFQLYKYDKLYTIW